MPKTFLRVKEGRRLLNLFVREGIEFHVSGLSAEPGLLPDNFKLFEIDEQIRDINESSLSLLIESDCTFLLTGDIEKEGLLNLVDKLAGRKVNVLEIPHHGSSNEYLGDLLDETNPEFAVVSSAYYFRNDRSINECASRGIKVSKTADAGAVSFTVSGGQIEVHEYARSLSSP